MAPTWLSSLIPSCQCGPGLLALAQAVGQHRGWTGVSVTVHLRQEGAGGLLLPQGKSPIELFQSAPVVAAGQALSWEAAMHAALSCQLLLTAPIAVLPLPVKQGRLAARYYC